jgi:hypothetical protein
VLTCILDVSTGIKPMKDLLFLGYSFVVDCCWEELSCSLLPTLARGSTIICKRAVFSNLAFWSCPSKSKFMMHLSYACHFYMIDGHFQVYQ